MQEPTGKYRTVTNAVAHGSIRRTHTSSYKRRLYSLVMQLQLSCVRGDKLLLCLFIVAAIELIEDNNYYPTKYRNRLSNDFRIADD